MKSHKKKILRTGLSGVAAVLLVACQTVSPPSSPSTPAPSTSTPSTSTPSTPSSSGSPLPPSGSPVGKDKKTGESQDRAESKGEQEPVESTAIPPEWEKETEPNDSDGSAESGAISDEVSFEEPSFDSSDSEQASVLSGPELEALEKELDDSLADFDEEIQREKTYAEERANENASAGSDNDRIDEGAVFEDYTGDEENGEGEAESSSQANNGGAGGQSPQSSNPRSGSADQTEQNGNTKSNVPEDVADGRDDDIVARQIREAAEKETDPELREKLWEEYRNYKN